MKTKTTFAIKGLEPQARSIFAFEAMGQKKQEQFANEHSVYVCRNSEGMFFSKNINDAFQFENEDKAESVLAMLLNSDNMSECEWESVLLVDGIEATEEQVEMYINDEL